MLQNRTRDTAAIALPPYGGVPLTLGSTGSAVYAVQTMLCALSGSIPDITPHKIDGIFGGDTRTAVIAFQRAAGLVVDGIVGRATWNALVSRYSTLPTAAFYGGSVLRRGSRGSSVVAVQEMLSLLSVGGYEAIPTLTTDGRFGAGTAEAVSIFQRLFGLEVDGAVGPATWYALVGISDGAQAGRLNPVRIPYNTTYRAGSSGDGVRILQGLLNTVARATGFAAPVAVDGRYGAATRSLVTAFQRSIGITADGIVGRVTWDALVEAFNLVIQTA